MLRTVSRSTLSSVRRSTTRQTSYKLPQKTYYQRNNQLTFSSSPPPPSTPPSSAATVAKYAKTRAGTGNMDGFGPGEEPMSMIPRGPVSWVSLGLVAVAAATAVGYYQIERERRLENAMGKIVSTGKPAIGGEWSLVDLDGNLVTNKSFEGKWTLLYFGFARCPDICPSEMVKVGQVMDTLAQEYPDLAKNVKPIFVSVDPARDSLKALKEYAKDFHPTYVFLTGSPDQVQQMAKKYRVYVSKADETEDGDYLVDHSIVIYFHDDTGDLADCFTQSMRPSDVVEKVVERMTFVSNV
mmetsp:Transcript_609/g.976  ORF Transcript_609/g.976 Transcript_609/m.976 type:complete len:296 (-) Transcript_609:39-926(-)